MIVDVKIISHNSKAKLTILLPMQVMEKEKNTSDRLINVFVKINPFKNLGIHHALFFTVRSRKSHFVDLVYAVYFSN